MADRFRFQAIKVALTYSMCPADREALAAFLKSLGKVESLVIGQEIHREGEDVEASAQGDEVLGSDSWGALHLHAYCKWSHKLRLEGQSCFDLEWKGETYHPNIVVPRTPAGWVAYCLKEDPNPINEHTLNDFTPDNYRKRKGDFEEWRADMTKKQRVPFVPDSFALPHFVDKHELKGRHRHFCLVGPPNTRKSSLIRGCITDDGEEIKGLIPSEHYYRVPSDPRYPFDRYNGQRFIIYDDVVPESRADLIQLCDSNIDEQPAPGTQRYFPRMIPAKQINVVIIICNVAQFHSCVEPLLADPALASRFKIYHYI